MPLLIANSSAFSLKLQTILFGYRNLNLVLNYKIYF